MKIGKMPILFIFLLIVPLASAGVTRSIQDNWICPPEQFIVRLTQSGASNTYAVEETLGQSWNIISSSISYILKDPDPNDGIKKIAWFGVPASQQISYTLQISNSGNYQISGVYVLDSGNEIPIAATQFTVHGSTCNPYTEDDLDGDGYGRGCSCQPDCNDNNPAVHSNAPEIENDGIDQDCDGCDFVDLDDDGYKKSGTGCGANDCNDNNPLINPGRPEIKNNDVDENCDGCIFIDNDNDNYPASSACGTIDCNDNDASVFPGAAEINCDGKDNDCSGGDCCPSASPSDISYYDTNCDGVIDKKYEFIVNYINRIVNPTLQQVLNAIPGSGYINPGTCTPTSEGIQYGNCNDGIDNDCDNLIDYNDDDCKKADHQSCSSNAECLSNNCGGPNMKCVPSGYQCYFNNPNEPVTLNNPGGGQDICTSDNSPWITHCDSSTYCATVGSYQCILSGTSGLWQSPCSGTTPACDSTTGNCKCTSTSCPPGYCCINGVCVLCSCNPSEPYSPSYGCNEDNRNKCTSDGNLIAEPCPSGQGCEGSNICYNSCSSTSETFCTNSAGSSAAGSYDTYTNAFCSGTSACIKCKTGYVKTGSAGSEYCILPCECTGSSCYTDYLTNNDHIGKKCNGCYYIDVAGAENEAANNCLNHLDDDCDRECDYDASGCQGITHGDIDCPVDLI